MGNTDLPKSFWSYSLETVVYILNRVPSKLVDVTPYEIWNNKKPYRSNMNVSGCLAYVKWILSDKLEKQWDISFTTLWNIRCLFKRMLFS